MIKEKNQSAILFKKLSVIKCGDCGHTVSKAEALEFEHCTECEACLDIPDEWFNELD
jgi:hypothetical protein